MSDDERVPATEVYELNPGDVYLYGRRPTPLTSFEEYDAYWFVLIS